MLKFLHDKFISSLLISNKYCSKTQKVQHEVSKTQVGWYFAADNEDAREEEVPPGACSVCYNPNVLVALQ